MGKNDSSICASSDARGNTITNFTGTVPPQDPNALKDPRVTSF